MLFFKLNTFSIGQLATFVGILPNEAIYNAHCTNSDSALLVVGRLENNSENTPVDGLHANWAAM